MFDFISVSNSNRKPSTIISCFTRVTHRRLRLNCASRIVPPGIELTLLRESSPGRATAMEQEACVVSRRDST